MVLAAGDATDVARSALGTTILRQPLVSFRLGVSELLAGDAPHRPGSCVSGALADTELSAP